jgi:hypothetical protein
LTDTSGVSELRQRIKSLARIGQVWTSQKCGSTHGISQLDQGLHSASSHLSFLILPPTSSLFQFYIPSYLPSLLLLSLLLLRLFWEEGKSTNQHSN